jgi:maltooligosyltrehalose trehalohydrolase
LGGFGLDAQWNDDFHHALRHALAGDDRGYFQDYREFRHLERTLSEGFSYQGEYSAYRRRRHGSDSRSFAPSRFVVCSQNHDQVGNRMMGDRLGHRVSLAKQKFAAAWTLLSPYLPLLFMGEEYNEPAPFPYFVSHGDPELVKAVREGRKREFAGFAWEGEPPDPQAEETFASAKVDPELRRRGKHAELYESYRALIQLRKELEPLARLSREGMEVVPDAANHVIWVSRRFEAQECVLAFCFDEEAAQVAFPFESGVFRKRFDSTIPHAEDQPEDQMEHLLKRGESVRHEPFAAVLYERASRTTATEVRG